MAATTTVTFGDLVEETLTFLYRAQERPAQTTVGTDDLATTSDTAMELADADAVYPPKVLEIGDEALLVTAKSGGATPTFTVSRGYMGTTAATAAAGDTVLISPAWYRRDVKNWLNRFYSGVLPAYLPNLTTAVFSRETDKVYIEMPAATMNVYSVRYMHPTTGRIMDLPGWQLERDLPASVVTSGQALRVSSLLDNDDEVMVQYESPYSFSDTTESGTLTVPAGTEDLGPIWAAAYGQMRREISRAELDSVEEWNQEQAIRAGVNLRVVRELWGEFYRRIDEAKRIQHRPKYRPYRKMPTNL